MEKGEHDIARSMAEKSIKKSPNALAYRNLALLEKYRENVKGVMESYQLALHQMSNHNNPSIITEYLQFLLSENKAEELWECYQDLPKHLQDEERIFLCAVKAALILDKLDFIPKAFKREYAYIRENETKLSEIWLEYYKKLEEIGGNQLNLTMDEVEKLHPIPREIDFRTL